MTHHGTVAAHFKDAKSEIALCEANEAPARWARRSTRSLRSPRCPAILVAGLPRSGAPALVQLLVGLFCVGCISHLVARFSEAPYTGALIAEDLRRRRNPAAPEFTSQLGVAHGYDGPHE